MAILHIYVRFLEEGQSLTIRHPHRHLPRGPSTWRTQSLPWGVFIVTRKRFARVKSESWNNGQFTNWIFFPMFGGCLWSMVYQWHLPYFLPKGFHLEMSTELHLNHAKWKIDENRNVDPLWLQLAGSLQFWDHPNFLGCLIFIVIFHGSLILTSRLKPFP